MSVKFFKPSDFYNSVLHSYNCKEIAADIANSKLEREGKVVYMGGASGWSDDPDNYFKGCKIDKKALLINIEPIEQCKHEASKVKLVLLGPWPTKREVFECECGMRVFPSQFSEVK